MLGTAGANKQAYLSRKIELMPAQPGEFGEILLHMEAQ